MRIFESFNFDIIIILILISSIISGLYFNLYRQGRRTLVLIMPIIILYFSYNLIYDYFKRIEFIDKILYAIINLFRITIYQETAYSLLVYFISYIILSSVIWIFYSMFRIPIQVRVLNKSNLFSRICSSLLGVFNGFVLGLLVMFILNPFIALNYEKPITKLYTQTANEVISFSNLHELMDVNIKTYNNYEDIINEVTGRKGLNSYYIIINKFTEIDKINYEIHNEIYNQLNENSKKLIDPINIQETFFDNIEKIVILEKGNLVQQRLREINSIYKKEKVYFVLYKNLENFELDSVINYINTNYEDLLTQIDKKLYKDEFATHYNNFKSYLEQYNRFKEFINCNGGLIEFTKKFENELNNNTEDFITRFKESYNPSEYDLFVNLNEIFDNFEYNKQVILKMDENMSLSVKVVLSSRYNYYFESNKNFEYELFKSYIIDSIVSKDSSGNELYSEYVFFLFLAEDIDFESFAVDDFIKIVNNLDDLVLGDVMTLDQANKYFYNLCYKKSKYLFNHITTETINDIKSLNNKYITDDIINLLD